jgi:hypothetical protein
VRGGGAPCSVGPMRAGGRFFFFFLPIFDPWARSIRGFSKPAMGRWDKLGFRDVAPVPKSVSRGAGQLVVDALMQRYPEALALERGRGPGVNRNP